MAVVFGFAGTDRRQSVRANVYNIEVGSPNIYLVLKRSVSAHNASVGQKLPEGLPAHDSAPRPEPPQRRPRVLERDVMPEWMDKDLKKLAQIRSYPDRGYKVLEILQEGEALVEIVELSEPPGGEVPGFLVQRFARTMDRRMLPELGLGRQPDGTYRVSIDLVNLRAGLPFEFSLDPKVNRVDSSDFVDAVAENRLPMAYSTSTHGHDVLVHLWSNILAFRDARIWEGFSSRARLYQRLRDDPRVAQNDELRARVRRWIEEFSREHDENTAQLEDYLSSAASGQPMRGFFEEPGFARGMVWASLAGLARGGRYAEESHRKQWYVQTDIEWWESHAPPDLVQMFKKEMLPSEPRISDDEIWRMVDATIALWNGH